MKKTPFNKIVLIISRFAHLPPLAWCARITKGSPEIFVSCGSAVEIFENGFAEGAWAGEFDSGGLMTAVSCCATGMVICEDFVEFIGPTHTIQPLYSLKHNNFVWVSNSLQFLISNSESSLQSSYPYYEPDLMTVMFGLKACKKSLPLSDGRSAEVHYHGHLQCRLNLSVTVILKYSQRAFATYDDYISFLQKEINLTVQNACDQRRLVQYSPLATVSTGYDSPMCAALARRAGCKEGLTLLKPTNSTTQPQASDNGKAIGSILGLSMTEISITEAGKANWQTEAEFIGTGYGSDDMVFGAAEPALRNCLLFVGMHGDKIWDTHLIKGEHLVRGDPSGSSMSEFRLRVGFIMIPVPFIGATNYGAITSISLSEEMTPWRVDDHTYDRPIPRRFVESFGVPRTSFGQSKKAIAAPLHPTGGEFSPRDSVLSHDACQRFEGFLKAQESHKIRAIVHDAMYLLSKNLIVRLTWNAHTSKLLDQLGILSGCQTFIWRYAKRWSENYWLFHWAFSETSKRYRQE